MTDAFAELELVFEAMDLRSAGSLVFMGSPISAAELVLRPLVAICVRLNIRGMRAREREDEVVPSTGWTCWYASNSTSTAFKARR